MMLSDGRKHQSTKKNLISNITVDQLHHPTRDCFDGCNASVFFLFGFRNHPCVSCIFADLMGYTVRFGIGHDGREKVSQEVIYVKIITISYRQILSIFLPIKFEQNIGAFETAPLGIYAMVYRLNRWIDTAVGSDVWTNMTWEWTFPWTGPGILVLNSWGKFALHESYKTGLKDVFWWSPTEAMDSFSSGNPSNVPYIGIKFDAIQRG